MGSVDKNICQICQAPILVMAYMGTGYCCLDCLKQSTESKELEKRAKLLNDQRSLYIQKHGTAKGFVFNDGASEE